MSNEAFVEPIRRYIVEHHLDGQDQLDARRR